MNVCDSQRIHHLGRRLLILQDEYEQVGYVATCTTREYQEAERKQASVARRMPKLIDQVTALVGHDRWDLTRRPCPVCTGTGGDPDRVDDDGVPYACTACFDGMQYVHVTGTVA